MDRSKPKLDINRTAITPAQQAISSCSGALVTALFMTPLDVVKIRLQAQTKPFKKGSCFVFHNGLMDCLCVCSYCNNNGNGNGKTNTTLKHSHGYESECPSPKARPKYRVWYDRPGHFKGTLDAFFKIARYEGISSLWSGLPPTLVMAVPATVVYFTCYDQLKYAMGYREENPSTKYIPILAGSTARVIAATLISPLELIRTKMQSQQLSYTQLGQAVQVTVKHGGLLSLMRGLGPTLLRDVPFSAFYWYGYELGKAYQLRRFQTTELSFTQSFLAGVSSGTVASVITLPFDVVKTHRQIEMGEAELLKDKKVSSTWSLMLRIVRNEGIAGLFAGIVPRVIKVAPACAMMISTYEYGKHYFQRHNEQKQYEDKWV